jgi:hypothetical protein
MTPIVDALGARRGLACQDPLGGFTSKRDTIWRMSVNIVDKNQRGRR